MQKTKICRVNGCMDCGTEHPDMDTEIRCPTCRAGEGKYPHPLGRSRQWGYNTKMECFPLWITLHPTPCDGCGEEIPTDTTIISHFFTDHTGEFRIGYWCRPCRPYYTHSKAESLADIPCSVLPKSSLNNEMRESRMEENLEPSTQPTVPVEPYEPITGKEGTEPLKPMLNSIFDWFDTLPEPTGSPDEDVIGSMRVPARSDTQHAGSAGDSMQTDRDSARLIGDSSQTDSVNDTTETLFADGGVIQDGNRVASRSSIGGGWAWCLVRGGEKGSIIASGSGVLIPKQIGEKTVTSPLIELWALLQAIEGVPVGWQGEVRDDCKNALGWVFWEYKVNNLPEPIRGRLRETLQIGRAGGLTPVLLGGHPTDADLKRGMRAARKDKAGNVIKAELPCSKWNCWCDAEAKRVGDEYLRTRQGAYSPCRSAD